MCFFNQFRSFVESVWTRITDCFYCCQSVEDPIFDEISKVSVRKSLGDTFYTEDGEIWEMDFPNWRDRALSRTKREEV